MTTVLDIEKKILDCKTKGEVYLTEEEKTNLILDSINAITKNINNVNSCYLMLFPLLDELSSCEVNNDKEFNALKEIILELSKFTTRTSILFSNLSKSNIIKNGCKSALNDLRANIRTLREYLEDVEETFLLEDDEADIDTVLSELI
ncbi:MAG: hypothetical protein H6587_06050 [Flavobacteriales bacterium]|nr:hypothetical protein [Flavobacteriales bacterium]MCB9364110.1 hypothetical protein [Flavobacteriales bacterium]